MKKKPTRRRQPDNNTQHVKLDDGLYRLVVAKAQQEQRTIHNMLLVLIRKGLVA